MTTYTEEQGSSLVDCAWEKGYETCKNDTFDLVDAAVKELSNCNYEEYCEIVGENKLIKEVVDLKNEIGEFSEENKKLKEEIEKLSNCNYEEYCEIVGENKLIKEVVDLKNEIGEFSDEINKLKEELAQTDEEDSSDEEPGSPQPLLPCPKDFAVMFGYDEPTIHLFKLFDEFKTPEVKRNKELTEDYEKAGQEIGNCLEATTSFGFTCLSSGSHSGEFYEDIKVMCFAHNYAQPNPQSLGNNTRIHWVLLYKGFLVDCSNGSNRGIWKYDDYIKLLPQQIIGSHTCKLNVYVKKLTKKHDFSCDNLYKYLGITMNQFYAKYLPEVEVINKKEIQKLMTLRVASPLGREGLTKR